MQKIKNSEYTVKDDSGKEVIFESFIPDALALPYCEVCKKYATNMEAHNSVEHGAKGYTSIIK